MKMKGYLSLFTAMFVLMMNGCNEEAPKASSKNQGFLFFGGAAQEVPNSTGRIQRAKQVITSMGGIKLDGSAGVQPFSDPFFGEGFITGIAADTKKRVIYLCHTKTNGISAPPEYSIVRVSFSGANLQVLYNEDDGVNDPGSIAFDDRTGTIYWTNNFLYPEAGEPYSQLMSASESGETSSIENLYTIPRGTGNIALDSESKKIYFSKFYAVPNDPDNSETEIGIMVKDLLTEAEPTWIYKYTNDQPISPAMFTINASANQVYWTDANTSKLFVGSLDGNQLPLEIYSAPFASDASSLLFGQFWPLAISLDVSTNTLFWSEIQPMGSVDNPRIMMMNLLENDPQVLVDNYLATNLYCARF